MHFDYTAEWVGGCSALRTPADRWFSYGERLLHVWLLLFFFLSTFDGSQAERLEGGDEGGGGRSQ